MGTCMQIVRNKTNTAHSLRAVIGGMQKHLAGQTVLVGGQRVAASAIQAALQAQIDALSASTAAKVAWLHAVRQQRAQLASVVNPYLDAVRHYAAAMFGTDTPEYQDFGFQPPKKAAKSTLTKVKAVLQSAATRVARHTMGPKQRLRIRGVVSSEALAKAVIDITAL